MRTEILSLSGSGEAGVGLGVGAGGDVIKKIDLAAEMALFDVLQERNVSCTVISEETGRREIGSQPTNLYLTVDPLDGTTNAIRGLPFMAVSIAASRAPYLKDVETALVSDLFHEVTYTAERGKGAHRNGERIKPSSTPSLEEAVIGIDLKKFKIDKLVDLLMPMLRKTKHLRHLGANALEVCYVADGTTDAFIDIRGKLRVTDMAAAYLILREAGGIIVAPGGNELNVPLEASQRVSFVAVANTQLYETIKKDLGFSKP